MATYFVISGYCGPDQFTKGHDGPVLKLEQFSSKESVLKAKKTFEEETKGRDNSHHTFRVIVGREIKLTPKTRVTEWDFEERE